MTGHCTIIAGHPPDPRPAPARGSLALGRIRLILAPLLIGIIPNLAAGPDPGPVGLALLAMAGGYAVSGRGPLWARIVAHMGDRLPPAVDSAVRARSMTPPPAIPAVESPG